MVYKGVLTKMQTEFQDPIQYYLVFNNDFIHVNQLLGKNVNMTFVGEECLNCKLSKEIYRQGFCKSCFFDTPNAGDWIMRPELSTAHLGKEDRDLEYEKKVQLQPHIVYLANSSNVKVGVTRKAQVPTRWIDQGAHEAIEIVEVPNRYLAGITEVALKDFVADKTNWRKMLKNDNEDENLKDWRDKLKTHIPDEAKEYFITHNEETHLNFPVLQYPEKPKSLNIKKEGKYSGKLVGVKGQYFIFEDNTVFNVRANEGLVVEIGI
ncbi:hypothetical protein BTO05_07105 [Winogradskyella sp. PC-19]|uniref:DUF2797 domain-containing protein n=1 Tax=unclassified Winogradskyella TaxID=2615021 RepID=UPI000B3C9047|nr:MULTISPECIES: DUF2797 domain-containing protein [unclassified Winogradskyella]ARV09417.1 hypothetical protein BTO05_07105 [Winogradskyella sp. PC-19]RZN82658.1 MAG: DUF2797 domain-containing protein [Winogradskyella sp.]